MHACLNTSKGERNGDEASGTVDTQLRACSCMDPVLLAGRQGQVLSTQREEGHIKATLQEDRMNTDHLTNCLQHLTSSRSIISEKKDLI